MSETPDIGTVDPVVTVTNQSAPLENYDSFSADLPLIEAVQRDGGGWATKSLLEAGTTFAEASSYRLAALANSHGPVLRSFDRNGRRTDQVEFHPAWHALLDMALSRGMVALPWNKPRPGSHVARAALIYLYAQTEAGSQCPVSMSHAAVPVLQQYASEMPQIKNLWLPKLLSQKYDARFVPASEKTGVLFGMGMTERQGGSDVRNNVTQAVPQGRGGRGQVYALTGHKWFMSAPMCDAFLVLAQAPAGLSCFLVPRFVEDGALNALHFQRLKDKLGNRSNASSEVQFHAATGYLLGNEGRGVATIIEMATYTRLDCVLATAGMQRRALVVALHHARQREAFGAKLVDKPLMANVLADLAIESEAATHLAIYLAKSFEPEAPESDRTIGRLLTPAAKYHVCKRGPQFAAEAMEVLGGNGYVEDYELARIYRELPLLSIWEGSGNVMCLDVLRGLARDPDTVDALAARLATVKGGNAHLDAFVSSLLHSLRQPGESDGRRVAHSIAQAVQGALLVQHAPTAVADTFCATRLAHGSGWGASFGTLPADVDVTSILERALPPGCGQEGVD